MSNTRKPVPIDPQIQADADASGMTSRLAEPSGLAHPPKAAHAAPGVTVGKPSKAERDVVGELIDRYASDATPVEKRKSIPGSRDELGDIVNRGDAEDGTRSFARSMAAVTDAIPGAVFGDEKNLRKLLSEKRLTPEQHAAFKRGGEQLYLEMVRNPKQWGKLMESVDLNGDQKIDRLEVAAYAAALDDKRTFARETFDQLATELASPAIVKLAKQYRDALTNPPVILSADAYPGVHAAQAPLPAHAKPASPPAKGGKADLGGIY